MKRLLFVFFFVPAIAHGQDCIKLQKRCDSLQAVVKLQNFRINSIKFYIRLVDKKPSNARYLKGWINAALK